jgi:hypothetical protein
MGPYRLVVSLTRARDRSLAMPAAEGAGDAELARLAANRTADLDRARWQAEQALYGVRY